MPRRALCLWATLGSVPPPPLENYYVTECRVMRLGTCGLSPCQKALCSVVGASALVFFNVLATEASSFLSHLPLIYYFIDLNLVDDSKSLVKLEYMLQFVFPLSFLSLMLSWLY